MFINGLTDFQRLRTDLGNESFQSDFLIDGGIMKSNRDDGNFRTSNEVKSEFNLQKAVVRH